MPKVVPTLASILCIILRYGLGSNRSGLLDLSYMHAEWVKTDIQVCTGQRSKVKGQRYLTYLGWQVLGAKHRDRGVLELNWVESSRNLETSFQM